MQTIMRQLLYSIAAGTDTVLVTIAAQTGSARGAWAAKCW